MDTRHAGGEAGRTTALVLGGGFAGISTAVRLARRGVDVTLVSAAAEQLVYPTSIWVATGEHRLEQSLLPLGDLARQHGFRFVQGRVERVDGPSRTAWVDGAPMSADSMVLALGAGRRRLPGQEHTANPWGEASDTAALGARVRALLDRGDGRIAVGFGGAPEDPSAVRGGPAFELLFNLDVLLRRHRLRDRFELVAFAPMANPGVRMGEKAAQAVGQMLRRKGIAARFGKKLQGFDERGVLLEGGDRVDADLVIFIPGGTGHPVLRASGLPLNAAGFVETDDRGLVVGHAGVYAVGDSAALQGPEWRAKQGHLAELMAEVAADDILATRDGRARPAGYVERVDLLCLMDMGTAAAWVHRTRRGERLLFLPWLGHWMKKGWGAYYRMGKLRPLAFLRWALGEAGRELRALVAGPPRPALLPALVPAAGAPALLGPAARGADPGEPGPSNANGVATRAGHG